MVDREPEVHGAETPSRSEAALSLDLDELERLEEEAAEHAGNCGALLFCSSLCIRCAAIDKWRHATPELLRLARIGQEAENEVDPPSHLDVWPCEDPDWSA